MDQLDLIDIYRTFRHKTMNFTFLTSAHGTFSRIDHILGHRFSLGKLKKKIGILPRNFSDHNVIRLYVKYRKKNNNKLLALIILTIKNTNIWRLKQHISK